MQRLRGGAPAITGGAGPPSVRPRSDCYYIFNHFRCLNYADITCNNGEVQSVDSEEKVRTPGTCRLLDIANGHHVKTVKILTPARTGHARITVFMAK